MDSKFGGGGKVGGGDTDKLNIDSIIARLLEGIYKSYFLSYVPIIYSYLFITATHFGTIIAGFSIYLFSICLFIFFTYFFIFYVSFFCYLYIYSSIYLSNDSSTIYHHHTCRKFCRDYSMA